MTLLFCLFVFLFLFHSTSLLLSLLVLEMLSFLVLYLFVFSYSVIIVSDILVLLFFSVFVMEGVIALSGLITLVTHTGSDYVSSSSILKC